MEVDPLGVAYAKEEATGLWWEIKSLRQLREKATCPLERISIDAQIDSAVFAYLAWSRAGKYQHSERMFFAATLTEY